MFAAKRTAKGRNTPVAAVVKNITHQNLGALGDGQGALAPFSFVSLCGAAQREKVFPKLKT